MTVAAVIAEYNPFHNGHALQLERTRTLHGATHIAAVMSGDFVQRGDCACISKWQRTRMALAGGADLVLELPLPWCMAGAEGFAAGGTAIAEALGCVDMLSFGSECGDIEQIQAAARLLTDESINAEILRIKNSEGITYAAARVRALGGSDCAAVLETPNDTLGVEYCRALDGMGSAIRPVCVTREGAAHDSSEHSSDGSIASGSRLREMLEEGGDISSAVPQCTAEIFAEAVEAGTAPASLKHIDRAMLYALRTMDEAQLCKLPDLSEGLENRLQRCIASAESFEQLCDMIKTKRYTHARIRRIVMSAVLGIDRDLCRDAQGWRKPPYLRILGMNSRGREILACAKPTLPIVTRHGDAERLDGFGQSIYRLNSKAADIFALCTPKIGGCGSDASHGIIVV